MQTIAEETDDVQVAMSDLLGLDPQGPELTALLQEEERAQEANIEEHFDGAGQEHGDGIGDVGAEGDVSLVEEETDYGRFLASLLVEHRVDGTVRRKGTGEIVGRIHQIGTDFKATCRVRGHGHCVCWLRVRQGDMQRQAEKDLLSWLDSGARGHRTTALAGEPDFEEG